MLGRWPGEPAFTAHRPGYLEDLLPLAGETPSGDFSELPDTPPKNSIELQLAAETIHLNPGDESTLFERSFGDIETTLSLHRFAWLPLAGKDLDPAWFVAIWRAWTSKYNQPADGWAWHPYTAAERVINILSFAQRNGLPAPLINSLSILAQHGPAIAERLEFFGDHHTSNHLANNGRGLFLLGLTLGLPKCAELGGRILTEEAKRIFSASGILREGSSHYHALLAVNYAQCADAAMEIDRPEAPALMAIAKDARAAAGYLKLPGGYPLIGDISPDISPDIIFNILSAVENPHGNALAGDGWYRLDSGPWAGLWHVSPEGFSHMPGHGHQDCGGFELHYNAERVFIDPGRGAYGETGEAALYRAGAMHNTLLIDGHDPYPANKPYYNDTFRRGVTGEPPEVVRQKNMLQLSHNGFSRLKSIESVTRQWRFTSASLILNDRVEGSGKHEMTRVLITPLDVQKSDGGVKLKGRQTSFQLQCDGHIDIESITRWTAYGVGEPAIRIRITNPTSLPWSGSLTLGAM